MSGYARIAIITGATSGIGEATARKFVAARVWRHRQRPQCRQAW